MLLYQLQGATQPYNGFLDSQDYAAITGSDYQLIAMKPVENPLWLNSSEKYLHEKLEEVKGLIKECANILAGSNSSSTTSKTNDQKDPVFKFS